VGLDREAGENVLRAKGDVYKKTGVSSTRLRLKNENGSGCILLCNRRDVFYGV